MPLADRHEEYARKVAGVLRQVGMRVETDNRNEKIGYKILKYKFYLEELKLKKVCIFLMCIILLTITGCSNKKLVTDMDYTFKGENEFWAAEFQVKGTGTSSQNFFGKVNFDIDLNKILIVTYKKDISQLSSVKHLEISCDEDLPLKGEPLVEDYNNGSQARKTYILKSHTTGPVVETGDFIIEVTINIDNQIPQIIKLENAQHNNEENGVKPDVIMVDKSIAVILERDKENRC